MTTSITTRRIDTLDMIRGAAVMGILLMNIVDMAMPGYAYYDPTYYGGADGVNFLTWALNYALFDGKMRGLFTMMFGASTVLIAERAAAAGENPARVHYARMFWLLVFGLIHAFLIWYGDILVLYSVCGALAYVAWRWTPRTLLTIGVALLALKLIIGVVLYSSLVGLEDAANAPDAPGDVRAEWLATETALTPPTPESQLEAYRGSYADALAARTPVALYIIMSAHPLAIPDTLALIAIGMALFRLGFWSGAWAPRTYRRIAFWSFAVCAPLYIPLIYWNDATGFSPITHQIAEALHLSLLRPWLTLGYASLVVLFAQSGAARWLAERMVAAGRMAFSNYLGTSVVVTLFFNGYGLGWYGHLERWQCYLVVPVVWAMILLWSKLWLNRYAYGPFEWLWRSLARGERQAFLRAAPNLDRGVATKNT